MNKIMKQFLKWLKALFTKKENNPQATEGLKKAFDKLKKDSKKLKATIPTSWRGCSPSQIELRQHLVKKGYRNKNW